MKLLKGEIEVQIDNTTMVSVNKTGNLLEITRHFEGSSPMDFISSVAVKMVVRDDGTTHAAKIVDRGQINKETFGHGLYDRLIEVYADSTEILCMFFWSTETGDYQTIPATFARGLKLRVQIERGAGEREVVVRENVDWDNMSKVEKYDFVLRKFSELLNKEGELTQEEAMQLATHKHYKGGLYRELGTIRDADNGQAAARTLYLHLFPHENSAWHRNAEEFHGFLDSGEKRFAKIEDQYPFILNDDGQSMEVNVVLHRFDDKPNANGVVFGGALGQKMIDDLNERARTTMFVGEYCPQYEPNDARFGKVNEFNTCCRFTNFTTTEVTTLKGHRQKVLVGTVQPYGPQAMDYMDKLRSSPLVGFAMRGYYETIVDGDKQYLSPSKIISFDFVAKR